MAKPLLNLREDYLTSQRYINSLCSFLVILTTLQNPKRSDWSEKQRRPVSTDIRTSKTFTKQQRGLHTVNEEDYYQQQQRQSFQRDSFQRESLSPLYQRKQRSSVTHFNNFPLAKVDDDERSRADVLAETEAKLSGHHRYEGGGLVRTPQDKQNRRLSEPNQYISQQQDPRKRMSFQQLDDFDLKRNSRQQDWRAPSNSRPNSTVGVVNNHRFSTGSSIFENSATASSGNQRKPLFASHLPFSSVVPHLKSNSLVSGLLRVNKRNRSDAYVFCEDINADIYICGSRDRNRALEGDHVAIRFMEVDQVMLEKHEKEEAKLARNNGLRVDRKPDEEDEKEIIFGGEEDVDLVTPRHCGVVVAILDRAQKQVFSG